MTKKQALNKLEKMTDREFNTFFEALPLRTQMLVKAGFVNWKEVLPQWYLNFTEHNERGIFNPYNK